MSQDLELLEKMRSACGTRLVRSSLEACFRIPGSYSLDDDGRITGLFFEQARWEAVGHMIPSFSRLKKLGLFSMKIREIPNGLRKLTHLLLTNNEITDIHPLADLKNLVELNLSGNKIQDLSPIQNLDGLTHLSLNYNRIRDLSPIGDLYSLVKLGLRQNQIRDLSPISGLGSLRYLDLSENQIQELSPIMGLHQLITLDLDHNRLQKQGRKNYFQINERIEKKDR